MNHRDRAKYAVATAIDTFRYIPTMVPWEPKFIRRDYRPKAITLIKSYPGYTVARKWGVRLEVEHGDQKSGCTGKYSFIYTTPENIFTRKCIMLRVLNIETWFHELCHVASCELNIDRFLALGMGSSNLIMETEANLGAASLLTLWQPAGYESELRHGFRCIKGDAKKNNRDPFELCEEVRADVEKQVAFILETEDEH